MWLEGVPNHHCPFLLSGGLQVLSQNLAWANQEALYKNKLQVVNLTDNSSSSAIFIATVETCYLCLMADEPSVNTGWKYILKDIVCGTLGGVAGIVAGQPLDTVKVRLQTQAPGTYAGPLDCTRQIFQAERIRGFYRGVIPPVIGNAPINAIIFAAYGEGMRYFSGPDGKSPVRPIHSGIAGCFAGLLQSVVASPTELIKIVQQVDTTTSGLSMWGVSKHLAKRNGVFNGFFRGFGATVARDVPSFGVYFYSYATTKDLLIDMKRREKRKTGGSGELTAIEEMSSVLVAGTMAGVSSWLFTYPMDVVKSARQMVVTQEAPPSSWAIAKERWNMEGHRYFVRGLGTSLMRAGPVSAVVFVVYESTMLLASRYLEEEEVGMDDEEAEAEKTIDELDP